MSDKKEFDNNWQELWMKQSKVFFEEAEKNLKKIFGGDDFANPQRHLQQIQQWADSLKAQWQWDKFSKEQNVYQDYWKWMAKMSSEATDMMVNEWMKRSQSSQPVHSAHDLYELWLKCCNDAYKNSMKNDNFQQMYGELVNETIKFWKNAMTSKH